MKRKKSPIIVLIFLLVPELLTKELSSGTPSVAGNLDPRASGSFRCRGMWLLVGHPLIYHLDLYIFYWLSLQKNFVLIVPVMIAYRPLITSATSRRVSSGSHSGTFSSENFQGVDKYYLFVNRSIVAINVSAEVCAHKFCALLRNETTINAVRKMFLLASEWLFDYRLSKRW